MEKRQILRRFSSLFTSYYGNSDGFLDEISQRQLERAQEDANAAFHMDLFQAAQSGNLNLAKDESVDAIDEINCLVKMAQSIYAEMRKTSIDDEKYVELTNQLKNISLKVSEMIVDRWEDVIPIKYNAQILIDGLINCSNEEKAKIKSLKETENNEKLNSILNEAKIISNKVAKYEKCENINEEYINIYEEINKLIDVLDDFDGIDIISAKKRVLIELQDLQVILDHKRNALQQKEKIKAQIQKNNEDLKAVNIESKSGIEIVEKQLNVLSEKVEKIHENEDQFWILDEEINACLAELTRIKSQKSHELRKLKLNSLSLILDLTSTLDSKFVLAEKIVAQVTVQERNEIQTPTEILEELVNKALKICEITGDVDDGHLVKLETDLNDVIDLVYDVSTTNDSELVVKRQALELMQDLKMRWAKKNKAIQTKNE